ncbi:MAG: hypothetical protein IJS29_03885, partial [Selenomonadaceae bacterium]|nr:hypothetical protein [Selenomonadaceae bacterium]
MKYEIKVWNVPGNMPTDIQPKNAAGLIQNIVNDANSVANDLNNVQNALQGNEAQEAHDPHQPDILIDENGDSEEVIKSVKTSYITNKDDNGNKIQSIKIEIKGNLYLPLDGGLAGDAKKLVGLQKGEENQRRNTLLLSKWASAIQPDPNANNNQQHDPNANNNQQHDPNANNQNADEPFYRAVAIRIMTKAGDFRV